ncbi:hypothetical protein BJ508DRAFT_306882 [Ascobolus immersus RN42]|uniref:HIG1 domain-containing protein n=1 Tax=Ascobolus immersus RN42 TaxID=1160509 RepID=A0A3N4IHM9_ASCIM|nr:hypothetical protein BJ508DRAFT_306882 [Ascobolus immersus RN42]
MSRPMPSSFDQEDEYAKLTAFGKLKHKIIREPLVPIGCLVTCFALLKATRAVRSGNKAGANKYFRARIYAQGFTLAAIMAGSYYYADERKKETAIDHAQINQRLESKQDKWIKELEFREQEEKQLEERAAKKRQEKKAAKGDSLE